MRFSWFTAGSLLSISAFLIGNGETTLGELNRRAVVIKPSTEELKWQRIPWLTDLAAAHRAARDEKRPIFLWVTGDDPLERC